MLCDIEMDWDGYGGVKLRSSTQKAKKPHSCDECWRKINIGEVYSKYVGIYDGDFFMVKHCLRCTKARDWLLSKGHGWINGQILDHVKLCVESDKDKFIAELKKKRAENN